MNKAVAILDCGEMVTASEVCMLNWRGEGWPCESGCPLASAGWFAMEIRKVLCSVVVFRKVTVKARCRSCVGLAAEKPSGFEFPRDQTCALPIRSEEHTSELQSHLNLVCRLLLEKKTSHHPRSHF